MEGSTDSACIMERWWSISPDLAISVHSPALLSRCSLMAALTHQDSSWEVQAQLVVASVVALDSNGRDVNHSVVVEERDALVSVISVRCPFASLMKASIAAYMYIWDLFMTPYRGVMFRGVWCYPIWPRDLDRLSFFISW